MMREGTLPNREGGCKRRAAERRTPAHEDNSQQPQNLHKQWDSGIHRLDLLWASTACNSQARQIFAVNATMDRGGRAWPNRNSMQETNGRLDGGVDRIDRLGDSNGGRDAGAPPDSPLHSHTLKHDGSVLALAVSSDRIYAGTETGEILVFSLATFQRERLIYAHEYSVLDLCLSQDEKLLFSGSRDWFVYVWCTTSFERLYRIHSQYRCGDIFCVAYSSSLETVYLGAQNTSIQWYDLKEANTRAPPCPSTHPYERHDRFFDSIGPGGVRTPRPDHYEESRSKHEEGQRLVIDKFYIHQYAHFGYVYCMLITQLQASDAAINEVLVTGGGDGTVKVWSLDATKGGAIKELYKLDDGREEGDSVLCLVIDGTFLYSGRLEGEVNIWDLETQQLVRSLRCHTQDVLTLSIGGDFLYCAGQNGSVEKYNPQYEIATKFRAHNGRILASACTRYNDRPIYITGASDESITIWHVQDASGRSHGEHITSDEKLLSSLKQLVSYRTVASDSRYQGECRRAAHYLRSIFASFGASTETLPLEDPQLNPIVLATFKGNPKTSKQRKRILFYGHYDVIPAENEHEKWVVDPFRMEGIDGYLYGRGTSDNKGPLLAAIYAVSELVLEKALESDIVFLVEGEEECGSRGFELAVRKYKQRIGPIDWILLANSYWLDDHVPCLTYGLRGVIHSTLEVSSARPDLHSGVDGSVGLDEALKDLVMLLNCVVGPHGHVYLPGFYDPILPLSEPEASLYADITAALLQRVDGQPMPDTTSSARSSRQGSLAHTDAGGYFFPSSTAGGAASRDPTQLAQALQRKWREASLTIHRFGTSGPGDNSTTIPRRAWVAISLRLVPNQEAGKIAEALRSFLHHEFERLGSTNCLDVTIDHMAEPWLGDLGNEIYKTLEKGIMKAWYGVEELSSKDDEKGKLPSVSKSGHASTPGPIPRRPLYIREGGSIPAIRFLEKEFGAPAAHFPCGQASDNAHLDNERLRLLNLYKSREVFRYVFKELPKKV